MQEITEYKLLRNEVSTLSDKLSHIHNKHMNCKKGCSECCMEFKVLPVEYFTMLDELKNKEITLSKINEDVKCKFLYDDSCSIYSSRPIICRSHGLPLLFMGESGEAWELSTCPLNFTDFDMFDQENTYPQDTFNSRLFVLNQKFISKYKKEKFTDFDMISVNRLIEDLAK